MIVSEKMAAARIRRTLKACQNRIDDQAGMYGADFPYLESILQNASEALDNAINDMTFED